MNAKTLVIVGCIIVFILSRAIRYTDSIENSTLRINAQIENHPVLLGKPETDVVTLEVTTGFPDSLRTIKKVELGFLSDAGLKNIESIRLYCITDENDFAKREQLSESFLENSLAVLKTEKQLHIGKNRFELAFKPTPEAALSDKVQLSFLKLYFSDGTLKKVDFSKTSTAIRFGLVLRAQGQDHCDTYRIPGLVTTNKGTLIAVYDIRYLNSCDLQGNIDVGMSRSTNGGKSWSPMQVIMDMGEWGGKPQAENGIGDPSVLVDEKTNTIWVAALWLNGHPGKTAWNASEPGISPDKTGQLMLVKSEDDGITWSKPVNITEQVKKPEWTLMFQGPGRGITLSNGTLVFPAQFRDAGKVPHSTIIYSKDRGKTWKVGTGAKPNTTEAQLVQLADGSLMLNMRDDKNRTQKGPDNGRAVAITKDLGATWITHPSSNSALPEPNCMASIISTHIQINGKQKQVLLFSNPDNKSKRANMTIKASINQGDTWPSNLQLEINSDEGYGYSCLTRIDQKNIGILYEGVKELYFQVIPLKDILKIKI